MQCLLHIQLHPICVNVCRSIHGISTFALQFYFMAFLCVSHLRQLPLLLSGMQLLSGLVLLLLLYMVLPWQHCSSHAAICNSRCRIPI